MPDMTKTETATAEESSAPAAPVEAQKPEKARSLWGDAWEDLRRNPYFLVSSVLISFLLLIAVVPGLFTSADPTKGDLVNHFLQKPQLGHVGSPDWLGWDGQGRSVYARLIYGTRASLIVAVCVTAIVTVVGGLTGMISGYFGGMTDAVISRITDVFFGIPFLLGAMVVLQAFTNRTVWTVVFALAFLGWTQITRVMRGAVITVKQADYVHAAKALGASTPGSCSGTSCRTPWRR